MDEIRLMFAGGGTGGHLYPAIAIADRIKKMLVNKAETKIEFVGTKRGLEYRMREQLGYNLNLLHIRGLRRSLAPSNLVVPFLALFALIRAWLLLGRFRPDVVVGTGGYVCWPLIRAAAMRSIPIVLQEQNSFPGLTTRQLSRFASQIYLGFARAAELIETKVKPIESGNPVREGLNLGSREEAIKEFGLDPNKITILVLGGSQGARVINESILLSIERGSLGDRYQLLWQSGKRDYKEVSVSANKKAFGTLFPFAQRMELVYAAADFAVARAGALTLAELELCQVPMLLVPYPYAAGDHQKKNAVDLADRGMAEVIDESELVNTDIVEKAIQIIESAQYEKMKSNLKLQAKEVPAVELIASGIIELIVKNGKKSNEN